MVFCPKSVEYFLNLITICCDIAFKESIKNPCPSSVILLPSRRKVFKCGNLPFTRESASILAP
jgi:hypothetical protein